MRKRKLPQGVFLLTIELEITNIYRKRDELTGSAIISMVLHAVLTQLKQYPEGRGALLYLQG